jgi:hypothetical protein
VQTYQEIYPSSPLGLGGTILHSEYFGAAKKLRQHLRNNIVQAIRAAIVPHMLQK